MKSLKLTMLYYRVVMPILWVGVLAIWIILYFVPAFVNTTLSTTLTPFLVLIVWISYRALDLAKYKKTLQMYYIQKLYHFPRRKILQIYTKFLIGWYEYDKVIDGINNYKSLDKIISGYSKFINQNEYIILQKLNVNSVDEAIKKSRPIYDACRYLSWFFVAIPFLYLLFAAITFGILGQLNRVETTNKLYNYVMHWVVPGLMILVFALQRIFLRAILKKYYTSYIYSVYNNESEQHLLALWRIKNNEFIFGGEQIKLNRQTRTMRGIVKFFNKSIEV